MPPAVTRRKHLKSRNGCLQCKTRRIKCDENGSVPCAQCIKSRHTCSFAPPPRPGVDSTFPANTMLDMELLHNFTTSTACSLSDDAQLQKFFSTDFVQLAVKNDYLLHCVLALSAFHLVYEDQTSDTDFSSRVDNAADRYMMVAHGHYEHALTGFRCSLSHLDSNNCHASFACVFLLFIVSLSRPSDPRILSHLTESGSEVVVGLWLDLQLSEWIILTKGLPSIVQHKSLYRSLREGPLGPLVTRRDGILPSDSSARNGPKGRIALFHLRKLSQAIQEKSSDPQIIRICSSSIDILRAVLDEVDISDDVALSFLWPVRLEPEYLAILGERRPEALLVFAYHCVLLHIMSSRWFTASWPQMIIKSIQHILNDAWMPLLSWPLETISDALGEIENPNSGDASCGP